MIALLVTSLVVAPAFGQSTTREVDALGSLLSEVRQLRQAIEGMTAASQRVQIALYSLQLQDSAVARAAQRADSAKGKCRSIEMSRQRILAGTPRGLEAPPAPAQSEPNRRQDEFKALLELETADLQSCQAADAEAAAQLRAEQVKLQDLQDRIAKLDKALEQMAAPSAK